MCVERERERERERYLSLPKRYSIELLSTESLVLGKLEQPSHRISSRRQHKQQWYTAVGVSVAASQVKWRRVDKFLAKVFTDKSCH